MVKNIFKKKKDVTAIIAEIHAEFDGATEKLLKEAKAILTEEKDTSKADRLKTLGFYKAAPVSEMEKISKERTIKKHIAEQIEYYQQWYPHNKFITEEIVKQICEKYGLMCGEVSYYTGAVPDKNIAEMEAFKLREEDMDKYSKFDDYRNSMMWLQMRQASPFRGLGNAFNLPVFEYKNEEEIMAATKKIRYSKKPFKICAPEKDFNMAYMTKKGHQLIPDPIVLQPVKGGYLIVTKWGLEASDELVVNTKEN